MLRCDPVVERAVVLPTRSRKVRRKDNAVILRRIELEGRAQNYVLDFGDAQFLREAIGNLEYVAQAENSRHLHALICDESNSRHAWRIWHDFCHVRQS